MLGTQNRILALNSRYAVVEVAGEQENRMPQGRDVLVLGGEEVVGCRVWFGGWEEEKRRKIEGACEEFILDKEACSWAREPGKMGSEPWDGTKAGRQEGRRVGGRCEGRHQSKKALPVTCKKEGTKRAKKKNKKRLGVHERNVLVQKEQQLWNIC